MINANLEFSDILSDTRRRPQHGDDRLGDSIVQSPENENWHRALVVKENKIATGSPSWRFEFRLLRLLDKSESGEEQIAVHFENLQGLDQVVLPDDVLDTDASAIWLVF